jgi:uncharacterized metal-binding protein
MLLLSFLLGALLAQRYKVFVLVPAMAFVCLVTVVVEFGHHATGWQTLGSALLEVIALQIGYLAGAGVHHLIAWVVSASKRRRCRGASMSCRHTAN